ncbi:hypothetical protein ACHAQH_006363 [Verticillium albo-atrum]
MWSHTTLVLGLACILPSSYAALVGTGIDMYKPPCAFACNGAISSNALSCSTLMDMEGMEAMPMTTPDCRANDTSFLTTLAWCLDTKCAEYHVPISKLQKFWEEQATGDPAVQPKWSFPVALQTIEKAPTQVLTMHDTLNFTALTSEEDWHVQYKTFIIILVTGFATPIVLTGLGYLPFMSRIFDKLKPFIVYPSLIGNYRVRPLPYLIGNAPSIGQGLYIALMIILNIVLTAVNYKSTQPNGWFASRYQEVLEYVMIRTGTLGFALAPLVILFAGRNNVLLWLSNWSHSTFMLLHRWVARIFGIQVIIHSITALALYIDIGTYSEELVLPYWIWGCVATVAVVIMLLASNLYVRRQSYEVFLIVHILLAVFVIAGCWYHVDLRFERKFGYEMWLYAACAVWFFDRLVRVLRVLKAGVRRAKVVDVDGEVLRVDIPGIRWAATPGQHVYAYFPTLNPLRPWENHPFSVIPTAMLRQKASLPGGGASLAGSESNDVETSSVLQCDRLLLIGGGIGITALLPWFNQHASVKLFWSVKDSTSGLVQALENVTDRVGEKDVRVGSRLDIDRLLGQEAQSGWTKIGVVVSGPGGLCDDVTAAVVAVGKRHKVVFDLEVDAYSW